MRITRKHRDVESRFRELLADAELPEPDDVGYEPESVVFYWHEPKTAVVVDFDRLDQLRREDSTDVGDEGPPEEGVSQDRLRSTTQERR
jgi:hypothetical protein